MDLLGSILNSMAEPPSQIKIDSKKNTNKVQSFKCNICGKIFPHRNSFRKHKMDHEEPPDILKREIYLHQLEYEDNVKKEKGSDLAIKTGLGESSNTDTVMKTQSHKCPVCCKLYESGKAFKTHVRNHKRNKLGERPYSKEFNAKKLKKDIPMLNLSLQSGEDETQISACTTVVEADQKANIGCESPATNQASVKSDNCDQPLKPTKNVEQAEVDKLTPNLGCLESKAAMPLQQSSYKCDICDKIFTKKKTYVNHKNNHKKNKNEAKFLFFNICNKKELIKIAKNKTCN